MGQALLAGSVLAACMAGLAAFFAPCCSFVMLPSYLASVAGARRWRMVLRSAVYVAGAATIVWPLTIGVAGLASIISGQHGMLFLVGGAVMLLVGWATLNGWMWNPPALSASDRDGLAGIYASDDSATPTYPRPLGAPPCARWAQDSDHRSPPKPALQLPHRAAADAAARTRGGPRCSLTERRSTQELATRADLGRSTLARARARRVE